RDDEQAQHVDLAVWIAMKYKYEKPSYHVEPCRTDAFRRQDHEYHHCWEIQVKRSKYC
ncbi:hypothetical protein Tco_0651319, partial [Tanacetum coccineum]